MPVADSHVLFYHPLEWLSTYNKTDLARLLIRGSVEQNPAPPMGMLRSPTKSTSFNSTTAATDKDDKVRTVRSLVEHLSSSFASPHNTNSKQNHAYYGIRLASFASWPLARSTGLAKAGFSYTRTRDIVKCLFCDIHVCRAHRHSSRLAMLFWILSQLLGLVKDTYIWVSSG